ncbi:flagellar motor switch protein FliN [Rickettsiales endosymbiont of Stachyamoeba lipophora]|uniref:flagellar motor switch protein FliN n=1 Tax=Rickettsiales endosymbiont of Stachyamoeba lipophora TaxID=2486578 RepID=UPI000F647AB9|nr:flagellar motor switch protein FliN [Rickettsiales endosymbiont of Stachyamoeba lipophora]AZL15282.1 flagellar motor switch protein FliN [Rickettsiales endosymbiont of Stachyamoeba lipophora]
MSEFSTADFDDAVNLSTVQDIPVKLTVILGRTSMLVGQLLKLGKGSVVVLDRSIGEPVEVLVNDRLVAKGEVVIVDDKVGVTLTEIIRNDKEL